MPDNPQRRPVPYSREAEEAVLGAILINPDSILRCCRDSASQ